MPPAACSSTASVARSSSAPLVALVGALVTLVFLPARAVDPDIEPHTAPVGVSADEVALIAAGSADALIALESDDPEAVSASRSEIDPSSSLAD